MRTRTAAQILKDAAEAAADFDPRPRADALLRFAGPLALLLAAAFLMATALMVIPGTALAEPEGLPQSLVTLSPAAVPSRTLEDLIYVPNLAPVRSRAATTDAAIAAAVELGTNPDLQPKKAFRKRNIDLFRAERQVEIGNQEMTVRLRLRAKSRETMSVELRF